jgi:hypothetical protein
VKIDEASFFFSGIEFTRIEENVIECGDSEEGADEEDH